VFGHRHNGGTIIIGAFRAFCVVHDAARAAAWWTSATAGQTWRLYVTTCTDRSTSAARFAGLGSTRYRARLTIIEAIGSSAISICPPVWLLDGVRKMHKIVGWPAAFGTTHLEPPRKKLIL